MAGLRRLRLPFLLAAVGAILFGVVVSHGSAPGTFDGAPPAPLAYSSGSFLDGWDVQVHDRDAASNPGGLSSMVAMHGSDCSAPPATHTTNGTIGDAVFQCANHVMTAINSGGYGVIYLTPPQMVDFSNGGTVSFDVNTDRMSTRDWWDVTVSPFLDAQALPLLSDLSQGVDLQNPNRNSVVVATDNGEAAPNLKVVTNGAIAYYGPPGWAGTPISYGITVGTNQDATRQPFRLTLTTTHVRFERLASATGSAVTFIDQDIPALAWSQGVVQIGHHSYNPTKDNAGVPATWHWDNVAISPSLPLTIGAFTSRWTQGGTITSLAPAPANAYLRFSAICAVKVNGVTATKVTDSGHPEHFSSYLVPVAEGSQSWDISFANDSWYSGPCLAKDYSLFSIGVANTSTPTATNTATNTPLPPSSTPIPPTNTPVPPTATPTRTPTPLSYRCINSLGQTKPGWVPGGRC